jgi:acetyl esterase/lipase
MSYPFDPEFVEAVAAMPPSDLSDIPASREQMAVTFTAVFGEPDRSGVAVRDEYVPGPEGAPDVHLRIFTPERVAAPAAVYDVHGGGFVLGSIDIFDTLNLRLARDLGVVVVTVEYRLAPEHPYPAPLEDCYAGLVWTAKNAAELGIDPDRIVIHGESAGGGLCAGLALLARDRGGPQIAFQFLAIPELDDRLDTPSMQAFTDTPIWSRPKAVVSWDSYLGAGKRGGPDVPVYAAPARATDLAGLPPAYVSVMEFDPLRDEGLAYAQRLMQSGVSVELHAFPGTFHGSSMIEQAAVSRRQAGEKLVVLRRALGV